tara:strand:+ start:3996 stop:4847 length:852 start_codon:yes stop_codon:yes gene_type:complete
MNIIVTGGAGFIGTNLINRLVAGGHKVTSIDNYSTGTLDNHNKDAFYIRQSVTSFDFDNYIPKVDLIFHLAAMSRIQPSFDNPVSTFTNNVLGTVKVLDYARKNKVKVVYAGSSSKWHDHTDSPYSTTKFLGEEACKLYRKAYDVDVEIARFYNVYGPYESLDVKNGNVIGIWRKQIELKKPLTIVGSGEQRRDFIHVDDIVLGLVKIGLGLQHHEDAWELGTGKNYSIIELYNFFKLKYNCDRINIPDQKGNYKATLQTNDDAQKRLGWKPKDRLKHYILNL